MLLTLLLALPAHAATLAGVTLPDTATVNGTSIPLNGMGLREKAGFLDIYVGGLYLAKPTHDGTTAATTDEAKRIVMHFVYKVSRAQMEESFTEGFANSPGATASEMATLSAMLPDSINVGQEVIIDYAPGVGTSMSIAGVKKGTIPGVSFMKALFGIYVGAKPPTADLKAGLLGS